jgi:hypothetical protein
MAREMGLVDPPPGTSRVHHRVVSFLWVVTLVQPIAFGSGEIGHHAVDSIDASATLRLAHFR